MNKRIVVLVMLFGIVIAGQFALMNHKLLQTRRALSKRIKGYRRDQKALTFALNKTTPYAFSLPKELEDVPYQDGEIILEVKNVELRNVFAPYNASLIETDGNNFRLFFRYDVVRQMHFNQFDTFIGCAELGSDFEQTEKEFIKINTQSVHSEDPRIIQDEKDYYLIYNDGPYPTSKDRRMFIAKLDYETLQPKFITKMNPHSASIEKNWVPFVHQNKPHFEYQIFTPRKVLRLEDPITSKLAQIEDPLPVGNIEWEKKWGKPLGGSSARLVDGQYLAFFHSKFMDAMGTYWYVMGAYTFEAEPPFRVTSMSKEPLLFKGIYQTESVNTADPQKFVIFPSGFAIKEYEGKTLLHLACGENDCAVKIITIDKDKLLESMISLNLGYRE